jgi:hypothetical protein
VRVLLVWDTDMTDVELEVMYGCLLWSVSNLLVNPKKLLRIVPKPNLISDIQASELPLKKTI